MFIKRKTVLILMSGFIFLAALLSCQMPGDQTSFSAGADVGKHATDANFTQAATGIQGSGTTTYSSSNTAVATVDSSTGEVDISTVGATTITATNAGDDTYLSATDSYVLTVSAVEFITTWETTEDNEIITILTNLTYTYSYTVDWGDSITDSTVYTGDATNTYTSAGTYTVKISGTYPRISFNPPSGNKDNFLSIENWGTIVWESMNNTFSYYSNLTCNAVDAPDLSNVTDMGSMFDNAAAFNGDLSSWDVSNVTDMNNMFIEAVAFNGDISSWNVSSVIDMDSMFYGAAAFTNHDLSGWTVGQVNSHTDFMTFAGAGNTEPIWP